jgi:hypothetical protein
VSYPAITSSAGCLRDSTIRMLPVQVLPETRPGTPRPMVLLFVQLYVNIENPVSRGIAERRTAQHDKSSIRQLSVDGCEAMDGRHEQGNRCGVYERPTLGTLQVTGSVRSSSACRNENSRYVRFKTVWKKKSSAE